MGEVDLSGYVEVVDRIKEFREKHPEGCFQTRIVEVPPPFNEKFVAVEARVYRDPEDELPAIDVAWEPVPGHTPFTKDSELMNASTSAVGRAIVYSLAADAHTVASANEIRARHGEGEGGEGNRKKPSEGQLNFLGDLLKEGGLKADAIGECIKYAEAELTGGKTGSISTLIDSMKGKPQNEKTDVANRMATAAKEWAKAAKTEGPNDKPETGGEQPPQEA